MNKLILLNGAAGVGKSTIARLYIDEHPLTLCVEGDQVIGMIGAWRQYELPARDLKFALIEAMVTTHLKTGHDVILPYLVGNAGDVQVFEDIAKAYGAAFFEIMLHVEKEEAVHRLLARGKWGEEGSKQLTEIDIPRIENLYDLMRRESAKRPNMEQVNVESGNIAETYAQVLEIIT